MHYLKSCLPPLAGGGGPRSGGGGLLQAVDACEAGIRTLSKERVPSNMKGYPPSFTIALTPPSVSLRSPPTPKWGWARKRWIPPSVSLRLPPTPQVGVGKKNTDAPFRLALLATHLPKREWAGKIRRRLPREAGGRKADTI